jgi:hypothetical protein
MTVKSRMDPSTHIARLDYLRLRPYGDSLATPAVTVWLGFAWIVILLMASIEGIVWGLIGASIVPRGAVWLSPVAGLFMCALMFAIIWIVDASLIMSERPVLRSSHLNPGVRQGVGALARWALGLVVRVFIVAVSLYVTAPFLAKLIRADDIASYHQRQVEQYYAQRDVALQARINEGAAKIEAVYRERAQPLEAQIAGINQALTLERERRTRIEAEYAPEIAVLRQDLAAVQVRVGDELMGRHGRPEGRGPEARKWEISANQLAGVLTAKQSEIDARIAAVAQRISDLEQALRTESETFERLRQEQQKRLDQVTAEETARQAEANPPRLTFAARSRILQALRESPDEQGVPHFETVEGFSQAALTVLFFALLALKLFEPPAVSAYFNEPLQLQYRKYLDGGLAEIPGFEPVANPGKRLNPVEFARLWQAYESDPAAFHEHRRALLEIREPLLEYQAEQSFQHELLARRLEKLNQEEEFARRRRDLELAAYDQELALRATQLQAQLNHELDVKRRGESVQVSQNGIREEMTRLRALESRQDAERLALRESGRKQGEGIETIRKQMEDAETGLAELTARSTELERTIAGATLTASDTDRKARKGFWSRGNSDGDTRAVRQFQRELKAIAKTIRIEDERLARLRAELRTLERRKINHDSELHEADARLTATRTRILFYEDRLADLLCSPLAETARIAPETQDVQHL